MANIDDEPAKFSELDLSEDAAITGDDITETLGDDDGSSIVKAYPDKENDADAAEDADA